MAEAINDVIQWKKFWQLISGKHFRTPKETVSEKLLEVSKELQDGILQFKQPSEKPTKTLESVMVGQEKWLPFTRDLQKFLDLEPVQTWEILCFYLVNEYRGSASSLSTYISSENSKLKLLLDIWGYYSMERIVMLKTVKHILEYCSTGNNPYSEEYMEVVNKVGLKNLRRSYIDQFKHLLNDVIPIKTIPGDILTSPQKLVSWSERSLREMKEILQIILLTIDLDGFEIAEMKQLIELFKSHSFGRQHNYLDAANDFHNDLIRSVTFSEVAIILRAFDINDRPAYQEEAWIIKMRDSLEKDIMTMHQYPEHGPILVIWMLFNFRLTSSEDEEVSNRYRQFGSRAVQLNVFTYLLGMIKHQMYTDQSSVAKILRKSVYNHLGHLCDLFDADGSVAKHANVIDLLSELLQTTSLALEFINNEDSPIRSLFSTAVESFPVDFVPLSMIANALASKNATANRYIREFLEHLPYYTEIDGNGKFNLRASNDAEDEAVLLNDYIPFQKIDFLIESGTRAVVMDKANQTLIHFRTQLNYFNVLHNEINQLLAYTTSYSEIDAQQLERVTSGVSYLAKTVRRIENPNEISSEMVHPTELVFDIIVKFKGTQNPPIALLANCLDVCSALVKLFDAEIFNRIISINVLPTLNHNGQEFRALANGRGFESGLVGAYLVNYEKNAGTYEFLMAYLNFLKVYSKLCKNNIYVVELPGLIFLLREIFPHIQTWRFDDEQNRTKIFTIVLQYIFDILQLSGDQLRNDPARTILRDTCVYSLLNLDNGLTLLRFVGIGNPCLQTIMANESNWVQASNTGLNQIVQLSLTILMQILRLKSHVITDPATTLSALETIIYTQPKQRDNLRIIPNVTSYMNNIFNRRLPILACRLLRRFAMEFQMSLLACLDMENDQIRLTFLQRLRDDLESDDLKIAILEFVEACIEKQPGLTEAFFEVTYEQDKRFLGKMRSKKTIADGIRVYMKEYLDAISTDPTKVASLLLSRIMSLFHSLWKNNMQSLVQELLDKPDFWSSLCNPLFAANINNDLRAYTQLFYILGIEAFKIRRLEGNIDAGLKTVFDKFLTVDVFEKWIKIVFNLPKVHEINHQNKEEVPEWLCRLQSFKDLLVLLLRQKPTSPIKFSDDCKKVLADHCLGALIERGECTEDLRPFVVLGELYLLVLLQFDHKYTDTEKEDEQLLRKIDNLLNSLEVSYMEHHSRAKESLLAVFIKAIDLLSSNLVKNPEIASSITRSVVNIVCKEIYTLEAQTREEIKASKGPSKEQLQALPQCQQTSTLLSLNLLNRLILIFDENADTIGSAWSTWFLDNKIVNRLLSCLNVIIPIYGKRKMTKELLGVLVQIAKSEFSRELLFVDIDEYLWLKLLPPKDLLHRPYAVVMETDGKWELHDWWPIYSKGIELVKILLEKHKYQFLKDAIFFIGVHEEYLMDSLLLAKQALDKNAIILIQKTLELICEISQYGREWRMEHGQSVMNLMKCIQILTDHLITLLFCPKILKRLIDGPSVSLDDFKDQAIVDASDELVPVMNELIEIVTLCAKCLLNFSPKLINLICDTEFVTAQWFPLIEIQFGPPKINSETHPQLSFGSMLKAVGLFTKSLNLQHHNFCETPLNKLPCEDDIDGSPTASNLSESNVLMQSMNAPATPPSSRKPFSKSLSMTSTTSVVSTTQIQPSNDLLTRLDCKLCISALEFILTLLASQSLLALKDVSLSDRDEQFKQLIRRELKTELSTFHDLVKKRILRDGKCNWSRRKFGISLMKNFTDDNDDNDDDAAPSGRQSPALARSSSDAKSLRAQVTRRNFQQHQTPVAPLFNMTSVYSPIGESTPKVGPTNNNPSPPMVGITPLKSILKPHSSTAMKRHVVFEEDSQYKKVCNEDEPIFFEPEEPVFTGLSFVKIVEEDYFHFLSNLFATICHTET